jgi:hypothetical protein
MDILNQKKETGNGWMFEQINFKSIGRHDYNMMPKEQYDAILFIYTVNPPVHVITNNY